MFYSDHIPTAGGQEEDEVARDYTYAEAAAKLRIAETTLRRWVSKGRIPCHRLGRKVRFTDEDLAAAYKPAPATARR
ncbi:DNA binding domain-containing protein, excisionase family [Micromonospora aurantiaca]|nr:DNA binding domain-containing protein, excisionase family [Micromonospora aurantiaca]